LTRSHLGYVSNDGAEVLAGVQDRGAAPRRYIDDQLSELVGFLGRFGLLPWPHFVRLHFEAFHIAGAHRRPKSYVWLRGVKVFNAGFSFLTG
jgi:hypothetical protein